MNLSETELMILNIIAEKSDRSLATSVLDAAVIEDSKYQHMMQTTLAN